MGLSSAARVKHLAVRLCGSVYPSFTTERCQNLLPWKQGAKVLRVDPIDYVTLDQEIYKKISQHCERVRETKSERDSWRERERERKRER